MDEHHRSVPRLIAAVRAIPSLVFIDPLTNEDAEVEEGRSKQKRQTQRQKKQRRASQSVAKPLVDATLFTDIGDVVPTSADAARELETHLIGKLRDILSVSIQILAHFIGQIQAHVLYRIISCYCKMITCRNSRKKSFLLLSMSQAKHLRPHHFQNRPPQSRKKRPGVYLLHQHSILRCFLFVSRTSLTRMRN